MTRWHRLLTWLKAEVPTPRWWFSLTPALFVALAFIAYLGYDAKETNAAQREADRVQSSTAVLVAQCQTGLEFRGASLDVLDILFPNPSALSAEAQDRLARARQVYEDRGSTCKAAEALCGCRVKRPNAPARKEG